MKFITPPRETLALMHPQQKRTAAVFDSDKRLVGHVFRGDGDMYVAVPVDRDKDCVRFGYRDAVARDYLKNLHKNPPAAAAIRANYEI